LSESILKKIILINSLSSNETDDKEGIVEESEVKERPKKRGESNRIYLEEEYPSPWRLLPTISFFQINKTKEKVNTLILGLFGLESKYYENEPVNKEVDFNKIISYKTDPDGKVLEVNKKK